MSKKKKITKKVFRLLTGVIVGGAIGSILGLTLAPKEGKKTRQIIRNKSMQMFLEGKKYLKEENQGWFKKLLIKVLSPKNKK